MSAREKSDIIFHAACLKIGADPAALPLVDHLLEALRLFPVASYKLQIIREALTNQKKADWNGRERKWGSWFWMDKPGFRFNGAYCDIALTAATGGPRLCTFTYEDQNFFSTECIALWADFCGGELA